MKLFLYSVLLFVNVCSTAVFSTDGIAVREAFAAEKTEPVRMEWKVDEVSREGLVSIPADAKLKLTPVVFAFHGHGGNMRHAARTFGYHTLWPEAIVVYLQGLNTPGRLTDPEGKKPGWQPSLGEQKDRDLKFFDAVLAKLKTEYHVDQKRIYSTGHSNGGGFTYLLGQARGDVFAALAPSAATPGRGWRDLKPVPILHVAGENDNLVKYQWQKLTIDGVLKLNGCETDGQPWAKSGDLVGTIYASKSGTPVVKLISPGTHKFPDEAPALIVKFFKEHSRQ